MEMIVTAIGFLSFVLSAIIFFKQLIKLFKFKKAGRKVDDEIELLKLKNEYIKKNLRWWIGCAIGFVLFLISIILYGVLWTN